MLMEYRTLTVDETNINALNVLAQEGWTVQASHREAHSWAFVLVRVCRRSE